MYKSMMILSSLLAYTGIECSDIFPLEPIQEYRIQQYKESINRQAIWYGKIRLRTQCIAAVSLLCFLYNWMQETTVPLRKIHELTKKCPCIIDHFKTDIPQILESSRGFYRWTTSAAKYLSSNLLYNIGGVVVPQLIAMRIFDSLNKKIDIFIHYPGSLDWFVEHETDFTNLLNQYEEKAVLFNDHEQHLTSELMRAKEFMSSQWSYFVKDIEKILAYIMYCRDIECVEEQECALIVASVSTCTGELGDTLSFWLSNGNETGSIFVNIQQFKAEMISLLHRFNRLLDADILLT